MVNAPTLLISLCCLLSACAAKSDSGADNGLYGEPVYGAADLDDGGWGDWQRGWYHGPGVYQGDADGFRGYGFAGHPGFGFRR